MASLKDVKFCFEAVNTANIDALIRTIRTLLNRENPEKTPPEWIAFINSGDKFLSFVDEQKEKFGETVDLFKSDGQVLGVISGILEEVGKAHWAVAGLSMIGHLLSKLLQMSENRDECLKLLQDMINLAENIKKLENLLPEENDKLTNALVIIVKGSMLCAKQLNSKNHKKLFRFLKSSLDSANLSTLRSEIAAVHNDLALTVVIENYKNSNQHPQRRPLSQPECPAQGVALEDREREIEIKLNMDPTDESFSAVVIHGFGGIGKTHLAKAVYYNLWSKQILKGYNHARVLLDIDPNNNDMRSKQKQILMDAFPNYNSGRPIDLRDTEDGKSCLKEAFEQSSKPVFLFIDNVQRAGDLKELLPKDLGRLPKSKHIRLLLTARRLKDTDIFRNHRHTYQVQPLPNCDAIKLLFNETKNLAHIIKNKDRILKICDGVPLALEIVRAELECNADRCDEILDDLDRAESIIGQGLTQRMVDIVYKGLAESTKEAFLDICCFFNGTRRKLVESAVGAVEFRDLEDAALITTRLEKEYYAPMQENEMIVVVHDVIRKIGLNKAKDTRITDIENFKIIAKDKKLENVKGIDLCRHENDRSPYELTKDQLKSMSESLRVLKLGLGMKIKYKSNIAFRKLRYVYLHENIRYLPFNVNNLDQLAVYEGPLLKGGVSIANLPQSLRHIRTLHSDGQYKYWEHKSKETPESRLQELMLKSFPMKTVPAGLKDFSALRTLWLEDWYEMEQFPDVICELLWLTTLSLVKCRFRRLPESFGNLASLTNLSLEGCDTLEELPSTMGMLKALKYINLKRCTCLKSLPWTFGELTALEGLIIMKCALLVEIPGFKKLTRLRYLNIQDCARQLGHDCRNVHRELQIEDKGSDDEDLSYLSRRPSLDIRYTSKGKWSVVVGSVVIFSFSRYLYYQMSGKIELYLIR